MTSPASAIGRPALGDQLTLLTGYDAGYAGHRTVDMALRTRLVPALADAPGSTPDRLAASLGLDRSYTAVWCRAALAASALDRDGDGYRLAPHMESPLLDGTSPAYVGALFKCSSSPRSSAASKTASPTAGAWGGTRPARTGPPASPRRAPASTPA